MSEKFTGPMLDIHLEGANIVFHSNLDGNQLIAILERLKQKILQTPQEQRIGDLKSPVLNPRRF